MTRTQSKKHEDTSLAFLRRMTFGSHLSFSLLMVLTLCLGTMACSPEVGSDRWCEKMKETAKVDWSTRDASDFAKHCLFKK